jgi:hypothetical protein
MEILFNIWFTLGFSGELPEPSDNGWADVLFGEEKSGRN